MDHGSDRMVALVDYTYAQLVAAQRIKASNDVNVCDKIGYAVIKRDNRIGSNIKVEKVYLFKPNTNSHLLLIHFGWHMMMLHWMAVWA